MASEDKDRNLLDEVADAANAINKIVDKNEQLIENLKSLAEDSGTSIDLSDREPLTQMDSTDDRIKIAMEVDPTAFDEAYISRRDDQLVVGVGDTKYVADMPDDANFDQLSYNYNNGVLDITMPRNDTGAEISVVDEIDGEKLDEGGEDGTD